MSEENKTQRRNLFSYDPGAYSEPETPTQKQEEAPAGRNLFQTDYTAADVNTKENTAAEQKTSAPRRSVEAQHPGYAAYRDSVQKADYKKYYDAAAAYQKKKTERENQQKAVDKAKNAFTKASNSRKSLDNVQVGGNKYTITVGGKDVVEPLRTAYEKGWMTVNQKNFMSNSPEAVLSNLGFTEKAQLENFENPFLNSDWTRRFLNPVLTADIFKKHVVNKCYLPALIGFVFCVLSFLPMNFFSIFCYLSMFFLGMGEMQIILSIIRIFTTPKGGRPNTGSLMALLQLILAIGIGRSSATIFRYMSTEMFAPAVVAAFILCWCSVYFIANFIVAIPGISNSIVKNDSSVSDGIYKPLFQEAESINGSQAIFYCLLHQNELVELIDQNNYSANVKSADRTVAWAKNDLTKEENKLAVCQKEEKAADTVFRQAAEELTRNLKPIEDWKRSPSVGDMVAYWTNHRKIGDPYFPDVIWSETYDKVGSARRLIKVTPIQHNGEPVMLEINPDDLKTAVCELVTIIKKMYAAEFTRVTLISPQADNFYAVLSDAGYKLKSWTEYQSYPEDDTVYQAMSSKERELIENEIVSKRSELHKYLDENKNTGSTLKGIAWVNSHRRENKGGTAPVIYDILLIQVPTTDDGGSNVIPSGELVGLTGDTENSKFHGILPIYIMKKGSKINESWQRQLSSCRKAAL